MVEVSEKERLRRRLERLENQGLEPKAKRKKHEAISFRFGPDHITKLRKLSDRSGIAQVEVMRVLIDNAWREVEEARKS